MPSLELRDIRKTFINGSVKTEVLRGISFDVEKGEYLSIMGPSGCGKSTLLNIVGCLDRPTSGSYMLAENNASALSDGRLALIRNTFIGFVFQSFHLLHNLSAKGNVELPLIYRGLDNKTRNRLSCEALEAVGLGHRKRHFPKQMSGGEQQRVAIARAIVGKPELLLADEPTGALDSKTSLMMMDIFDSLNRNLGLTIVQVTHDRNVALYGQKIINLIDGHIDYIETFEEEERLTYIKERTELLRKEQETEVLEATEKEKAESEKKEKKERKRKEV